MDCIVHGVTELETTERLSLSFSPKTREIKAKIYKWDLTKLTNFHTAKETINKTKRQHTDWEKIFASDVTNKSLASKIYKELIQPKNRKTTQSKMGRRLTRHFSKEDLNSVRFSRSVVSDSMTP